MVSLCGKRRKQLIRDVAYQNINDIHQINDELRLDIGVELASDRRKKAALEKERALILEGAGLLHAYEMLDMDMPDDTKKIQQAFYRAGMNSIHKRLEELYQ